MPRSIVPVSLLGTYTWLTLRRSRLEDQDHGRGPSVRVQRIGLSPYGGTWTERELQQGLVDRWSIL